MRLKAACRWEIAHRGGFVYSFEINLSNLQSGEPCSRLFHLLASTASARENSGSFALSGSSGGDDPLASNRPANHNVTSAHTHTHTCAL